MGILNTSKALYKAQQVKRRMSKIEAAGQSGSVSILINGLHEIVDVEIDTEQLAEAAEGISSEGLDKVARELEESVKKAVAAAKKQIEKELVNNTNIDDLKGLL